MSAGKLGGRVALVTGAGTQDEVGIGGAIAIALAREGARLWVLDRQEASARTTCEMIRNEGGHAEMIIADVSDPLDVEHMVAMMAEDRTAPDILVNNVGVSGGGGPLQALDLAVWQSVMDVNLKGAVQVTRALVGGMAASKRGVIINIGSIAGARASGESFAYPLSKAALHAFTQGLAVTYGREGIRANTVAPGHMLTPMVQDRLSATARRRRREVAPLPIEGSAWDVALAVLFLCSDDARFITGVCLPVDGGVGILSALAAVERTLG